MAPRREPFLFWNLYLGISIPSLESAIAESRLHPSELLRLNHLDQMV